MKLEVIYLYTHNIYIYIYIQIYVQIHVQMENYFFVESRMLIYLL